VIDDDQLESGLARREHSAVARGCHRDDTGGLSVDRRCVGLSTAGMCDDAIGRGFLDQVWSGKARIRKRRDLCFKLIGELGRQSKMNEVVFACQGHMNQFLRSRNFRNEDAENRNRGAGIRRVGVKNLSLLPTPDLLISVTLSVPGRTAC
jgi:hypothetical protein